MTTPGMIRAVPTTYRGTRFRSTLEADWAATFDSLDWYWQYEPEAVYVGQTAYRCDFYLPTQRVWCEVKGPHNERIEKAALLDQALAGDPWDVHAPLVVVLRPPGPGEVCVWEKVNSLQDLTVATCSECGHHAFLDYDGIWSCRRCYAGGKFWNPNGAVYWPGQIHFTRSPQPARKAAR